MMKLAEVSPLWAKAVSPHIVSAAMRAMLRKN
jgi:hypothetical protein